MHALANAVHLLAGRFLPAGARRSRFSIARIARVVRDVDVFNLLRDRSGK
jgi:hypothetical protein